MTAEPLEFRGVEIQGGDRQLLFIHGYGGNLEQPGVKWTMNRFADAGFSVTYVQLPTVIDDLKRDILEPVTEVQGSLGEHVTAGFSLGGLTAAYLTGAVRTVYLSPFWGINDRWTFKGLGTLLKVLAGINVPSLKRRFEMEDAGPLAVEEDMIGIPDFVTPRTIREMHLAQLHMPEPDPRDVVFYCPKDNVISVRSIERRNMEKHTFRGGHMFYLSRERDSIMRKVISVLDGHLY